MFLRLLAKNRFCLFFVYIVSDCEYFQNFEGALTLWRHTKTDGTFVGINQGMERGDL